MNNREIAHEWFAMGDLDLDSAAFLYPTPDKRETPSGLKRL